MKDDGVSSLACAISACIFLTLTEPMWDAVESPLIMVGALEFCPALS